MPYIFRENSSLDYLLLCPSHVPLIVIWPKKCGELQFCGKKRNRFFHFEHFLKYHFQAIPSRKNSHIHFLIFWRCYFPDLLYAFKEFFFLAPELIFLDFQQGTQ